MEKDYLSLSIAYYIKDGKFDISGDVKKEKQADLIIEFLRGQIGKGIDISKANERDVYHIELRWYPENDRIECMYDTGNKGLREGILKDIVSRL